MPRTTNGSSDLKRKSSFKSSTTKKKGEKRSSSKKSNHSHSNLKSSARNRSKIQSKSIRANKESLEETKLILFNKPFNTLCQFTGEKNDSTLADFINIPGVYPAGRLDKDSEGLLLLTNDGQLQHQISHPKFKKWKTYWVQVEGEINQEAINKLVNGVELKDGLTKPAKAELLDSNSTEESLWERSPPVRYRAQIPTSWIALSINEGKNRQVRRMTAAVGFPTLRLIRVSIDQWKLVDLKPGEFKEIIVN